MPAEVFISYARRDREQVLPWIQHLQQAGVSVWIDESHIGGASLWTQEIIEAIRACRVLLLGLRAWGALPRLVQQEAATRALDRQTI